MKITVCDKWDIQVGQEAMAMGVVSAKHTPYFWFLVARPSHVASEAWAIKYIVEMMTGVSSVVDYFGGVGISSTIIHNILHPEQYYIVDVDPACVAHLSKLPMCRDNEGYDVVLADSYDVMGDFDCDLAVLDFNSFTVLQLSRNAKLATALGRVTANTPDYIIIADSAIYKLHMNLAAYTKMGYGDVTDLTSYLRVASEFMYHAYGYSLAHVAWFRGAACCLYVPEEIENPEIIAVPKEARTYFKLEV